MTRILALSFLLLAAGCANKAVRADAPATAQPTPSEANDEQADDHEGHANAQPLLDSDEGAIKVFDHKPEPGEKAICAVSDEPFTITAETKVAEYNGKWYAFCCDDCEPAFTENPAEYAVD